MTTESLIDRLGGLLPLTEETVEEYLSIVNQLIDTGDPRVIQPILSTIDDNLDLGGVSDATLNALEEFPAEVYARELLADLERLHCQSPHAARVEISKYLWSSAEQTLIDELAEAGAGGRASLRRILETLAEEVPRLADGCTRVIRHLDEMPAGEPSRKGGRSPTGGRG